MVNSIRIKNLRSLKDTDNISIKKLNILVGSNSSGKSTFLRVFPLLKQSFNKKINGPILWCGDDDDYVDFGSFQEALRYNSENKSISLAFEMDMNYENRYGRKEYRRTRDKTRGKTRGKTYIEFLIKSRTDNINDYISELRCDVNDQKFVAYFEEDGNISKVKLNEEKMEINKERESFFFPFYERGIFDISLYQIRENAIYNLMSLFSIEQDEIQNTRMLDEGTDYIVNEKILKMKSFTEYNTKIIDKVEKIYMAGEKKKIKEIERWAYMYNLPNYFFNLSRNLNSYFSNVYYIAPVRATAERYYRLRNAAVNEVDCRGKNLPVFLNSLSKQDFEQFQDWTNEHLGFTVEKKTSEGHVSLKIKKKGQKKAVNLSDTGFGYSQILPIVTQIWYIAKKARSHSRFFVQDSSLPIIIIIEQPELHLHPALQAKLIDIIVKVASEQNVNFIIETHSETMINRVGSSIENEKIKNSDVGVLIFEKKFGEDDTLVKRGGFDEEGYLENWPIGFFDPEMEL